MAAGGGGVGSGGHGLAVFGRAGIFQRLYIAARLLHQILHRGDHRFAGDGGAGHGVYLQRLGVHNLLRQILDSAVADAFRLAVGRDGQALDGIFGKHALHGEGAVAPVHRDGVGARLIAGARGCTAAAGAAGGEKRYRQHQGKNDCCCSFHSSYLLWVWQQFNIRGILG